MWNTANSPTSAPDASQRGVPKWLVKQLRAALVLLLVVHSCGRPHDVRERTVWSDSSDNSNLILGSAFVDGRLHFLLRHDNLSNSSVVVTVDADADSSQEVSRLEVPGLWDDMCGMANSKQLVLLDTEGASIWLVDLPTGNVSPLACGPPHPLDADCLTHLLPAQPVTLECRERTDGVCMVYVSVSDDNARMVTVDYACDGAPAPAPSPHKLRFAWSTAVCLAIFGTGALLASAVVLALTMERNARQCRRLGFRLQGGEHLAPLAISVPSRTFQERAAAEDAVDAPEEAQPLLPSGRALHRMFFGSPLASEADLSQPLLGRRSMPRLDLDPESLLASRPRIPRMAKGGLAALPRAASTNSSLSSML